MTLFSSYLHLHGVECKLDWRLAGHRQEKVLPLVIWTFWLPCRRQEDRALRNHLRQAQQKLIRCQIIYSLSSVPCFLHPVFGAW